MKADFYKENRRAFMEKVETGTLSVFMPTEILYILQELSKEIRF